MKKLLLIAAASLTLAATVPASAQVYFGAGPGGVGVGVGDPDYGWRHRHWRDSYAFDRDDCRVIRERIVTPSGRVIFATSASRRAPCCTTEWPCLAQGHSF
jgi:hypothetical protein